MKDEKANILLVDDNHDNLRFLSSILARQGYEVRPTDSGDKALAAIRAKQPELIMLDVMMPDMSGFDVCDRLKADQNTRDVPVIFISAIHEVEEKARAFSFGAVDYITKPFQEQEVLARVETHLKLRRFQTLLEEKTNNFNRKSTAVSWLRVICSV
jgi:DNA-binding response OmpR family regulator